MEIENIEIPDPLDYTVAGELARIRELLEAPARTIRNRIRITANDNPVDLMAEHGFPFGAAYIENPNDVTLEIGFAGQQGMPGRSDEQVQPRAWQTIAQRFEVLSIGVDRAVAFPANGFEVFVSRHDRVLPPAAGPLGNVGTLATSPSFVDIVDEATRELGRVGPTAGVAFPTLVGIGESVSGAGVVTAPGANVAIATIAAGSLGAGVYRVEVSTHQEGTVDVTTRANMRLRHGGTGMGSLLSTATRVTRTFERVSVLAAENLVVESVVAAAAGSVYAAEIVATRIA